MKRFRSPIQKVQRIQHQQQRIAELHLAQAQSAIRQAEATIHNLQQQSIQIEATVVAQLTQQKTGLAPGIFQASRAHLDSCQASIRNQTQHRDQLVRDMLRVQSAYSKLKARSDGVDELMQKKHTEHRQQAMLQEQTELEESARTLKLLNPTEDDGDRTSHCLEVADGVTQK